MGSTNKTDLIFQLSQFVSGVDKPGWLTDYNTDMKRIADRAMAKSVFDPNGVVAAALGIPLYVAQQIAGKANKGPIGGKLLFDGSTAIGAVGSAPGLSNYPLVAVGTSATSSTWGVCYQPAGSPIRGSAFYCAGSLMNVAAWTLTVSGDNFTVTRLQSINLGPSGATGWDGTTGSITRIYGIEI